MLRIGGVIASGSVRTVLKVTIACLCFVLALHIAEVEPFNLWTSSPKQMTVARMYRAVRVKEFGGPEQLVVEELPGLKPAAGQVRLRNCRETPFCFLC